MNNSVLALQFLGTSVAHLDQTPITTFGSAKVEALLAYLSVEHQKAHPRDVLSAMFWPEQNAQNAGTSFRQALARLRKALSDKEATPSYLIIAGRTVQWNTASRQSVDVNMLRDVLNLTETISTPVEAERLEAALATYHGPFLAGLSIPDAEEFESWVRLTREHLAIAVFDGYGRLTMYAHQNRDYDAMVNFAGRQIEINPVGENGFRQLMMALALQGRRAEALAQYDRCFEVLQQQLGVEPDNETNALYAEIASGRIERGESPNGSLGTSLDPLPKDDLPVLLLPTEPIPQPAHLPLGSLMPLRRNPHFVGRESDLRELAQALSQGNDAAVSQVETAAATGLGGIGKTQLACEFVHRYGQFFPGGIYWMSFDNAESVAAEVAACGGAGALELRSDFGSRSLDEQVRLVQSAWQEPTPRLLIFDNCEDLALLDEWRPTTGGCRILVTSRRGDWEELPGISMLALGVLSRGESIALLAQHCPHADQDVLFAIADELGDLPLALHLAGSYLQRYRRTVTPTAYLAELQDPKLLRHPSLTSGGISLTGHVQHVGRTFALSFDMLDADDELDKLALDLLVHAAHFAPGEPIWYELLIKTLGLDSTKREDALRADDAFQRLIELGVVETEEQVVATNSEGATTIDETGFHSILRMHRLVAAFVRDSFHDRVEETQKAVEEVVFDETANRNRGVEPLHLLAWQSHLRAVADLSQVREDEESARLCNELGQHLIQIGDYHSALQYHEKALAIREQVFGELHVDTATSLLNYGESLRRTGRLNETEAYFRRSLEIRQELLGDEHTDTAQSLENLGRCLQETGDPEAGLPYIRQALTIIQTVEGEESARAAEYHNNLAYCLLDSGELTSALENLKEALSINQKILGPEHPYTSLNHHNIAALFRRQGRFEDAEQHFQRALSIRHKVYGEQHPDSAITENNLALLYFEMDRLDDARKTVDRALPKHISLFGESHIRTSYCYRVLGNIHAKMGSLDDAVAALKKALAIRNSVLGKDHTLSKEVATELDLLIDRSAT